ncbi:MAG TPA: hypothetical protein PKZ76_02535 [Xanthomonadaceae bacterium]|nr:hypothetical protein [Xanthomonadaceae bacterium]
MIRRALVTILALASCGQTLAQGVEITYQGQLKQTGEPFSGLVDMEFRLFNQLVGGSQVGLTVVRSGVPVDGGLFQVLLDFTVFDFEGFEPRFLDIRVNGTILVPRQPVTAVPIAAHAITSADGGSPWTSVSGGLEYNAGRVRIGLGSFADARLRVDAGSNLDGVHASTATDGGWAVLAQATGTGATGVRASASGTGGTAVYGVAAVASGLTTGVLGESTSTTGRGVFGRATAASGNNSGVWGQSASTTGRGVFGEATSTTGINFGVFGQSASSDGRGVVGLATAASGNTFGVRGVSNSNSGVGVFGEATAGSGDTDGVLGVAASTTGHGVWGRHTASSGNGAGVLGTTASTGGWGVFSGGNLGASGTKSFLIDHPLDPENRYLRHYSAEGPEPQNIYNGVATLDERGEAWVELPPFFAAISRDPRYQLTALGAFAPLYIADEIDFGVEISRFRIAGGPPGLRVSWEVKAIRHDPYVRASGIVVEEDKVGAARGTYLHPELFGQPPERGEHYRRVPDDDSPDATSHGGSQ